MITRSSAFGVFASTASCRSTTPSATESSNVSVPNTGKNCSGVCTASGGGADGRAANGDVALAHIGDVGGIRIGIPGAAHDQRRHRLHLDRGRHRPGNPEDDGADEGQETYRQRTNDLAHDRDLSITDSERSARHGRPTPARVGLPTPPQHHRWILHPRQRSDAKFAPARQSIVDSSSIVLASSTKFRVANIVCGFNNSLRSRSVACRSPRQPAGLQATPVRGRQPSRTTTLRSAFTCGGCLPTVGYAGDFQSTGDLMTRSLRASLVAVAAIAVGIALSGCGSDTKTEPTPSKQTSTES